MDRVLAGGSYTSLDDLTKTIKFLVRQFSSALLNETEVFCVLGCTFPASATQYISNGFSDKLLRSVKVGATLKSIYIYLLDFQSLYVNDTELRSFEVWINDALLNYLLGNSKS